MKAVTARELRARFRAQHGLVTRLDLRLLVLDPRRVIRDGHEAKALAAKSRPGGRLAGP